MVRWVQAPNITIVRSAYLFTGVDFPSGIILGKVKLITLLITLGGYYPFRIHQQPVQGTA